MNPRTDIALATGFRFTAKSKAMQVQVVSAETKAGGQQVDTAFADAFQGWYVVAPPPKQDVDAAGAMSGAAEFITCEVGDQPVMHGSRDVRVSKYGQDLKEGEFALINSDGFRIMVGHKQVGLTAGGGFLNFDVENKKVGLTGIPSSAGLPVPYVSITTDTIGLVSATGASSFGLSDTQVTISGSAISLEGGRVNLGVGASDPVVTYSQLMKVVVQLLTQLNIWMVQHNTNVPAPIPGSVFAPIVVVAIPGTRVFAPAL